MIKGKKTDSVTIGIPDIDTEAVLGALTLDSHSSCSYIQSAKPMVTIRKCHDGLFHSTL